MDIQSLNLAIQKFEGGIFFRKELAYGYVAIIQQHAHDKFELKIFRPLGGEPQTFSSRFSTFAQAKKFASHFVRTEVRYNLIWAYGRSNDDFYSKNFNTREWWLGREALRKEVNFYG